MAYPATLDLGLDEEIKRRKTEDALSALIDPSGASNYQTDSTPDDASSSDDNQPVVTDHDIKKFNLIPESEADKKQAAAPTPAPTPDATVYPTISSDQPQGLPVTKEYPRLSPPPPEPADIQTDADTGQRYVTDASGTVVPHAELATEADKQAFRPGDVTLPQQTVQGVASTQPAPDKLDQVERAQLVAFPDRTPATMPWYPAGEAPDTLAQVERGTLVKPPPKPVPGFVEGSDNTIVNPAGAVSPTAKPAYPAQIVTPDEFSGKTSVVNAPAGTQQNTQVTPTDSTKPSATAAEEPSTLYGMPIAGREKAAPVTATPEANPDGSPFPAKVLAVDGNEPKALIIHHTGDHHTAAQTAQVLKDRGLSVEYTIDRGGNLVQIGGPGSQHILTGWGDIGTGLNNSNVVGVEVAANDNKDLNSAQVATLVKLGRMYGNTPVYGHGQVNPGHKEADEGMTGVNAIMADRKSGGGAAAASRYGKLIPEGQDDTAAANQPSGGANQSQGKDAATTSAGPFVSGRATTFGYHDPEDEGVGSPSLGKINTNDPKLVGIAVPEEALLRQLGANKSDWRTARVEVVGPDGRHFLMPIVDIGPKDTSQQRGVAADFTHGAAVLLNHDDSNTYQFRIIPDAGPDAEKQPQDFIAEQRALAAGKTYQPQAVGATAGATAGATGATGVTGVASSRYGKLIPEDQVPTEAVTAPPAGSDQEKTTLQAISDQTPNRGELWRKLQGDIPGVSAPVLAAYRDKVKQQITDYAVNYYHDSNPNITPDQAFKQATGDADFGTFAGEVATKIIPNLNKAAIALERSQGTIDENRVMTFLKTLNPNVAPDKLVEVKRQLMAESSQDRAIQINHLIQMSGQEFPGMDPVAIADSFDRVSDPVYQAKRKAQLDLAVAKNTHDLTTDPRLVNTPAEGVTQWLASAPKNISEMLTGPIGQSMMLSEIYTDTADQLRKEHPDWSEDDVKSKASASTVAQMGPQEIIALATGGALSALSKGFTQPLLELGARLGLHGTVAAVAGGIQQLAKNSVEGNPRGLMDGVPEAALAAAPFGVIGATMHGRTPVETKPEAVPPPLPEAVPPPLPEQSRPVTSPEAEVTPPAVRPEQPAVAGRSAGPSATEPVTAAGPVTASGEVDRTQTPQVSAEEILKSNPDHPAAVQGDVLDSVSKTLFPDLNTDQARNIADRASLLSVSNLETSRFRYELEQFLPQDTPTNFGPTKRLLQAYYAFRDGPTELTAKEISTAEKAYNDARENQPPAVIDERFSQPASAQPPVSARPPAAVPPTTVAEAIRSARSDAVAAQLGVPSAVPRPGITPDPAATRTAVYHDLVARGMDETQAGNLVNNAKGKTQADILTDVQTQMRGVSESDPYMSKVANRYMVERVANGEIAPIEPGHGDSPEMMLAKASRMSPEQVNQYVSDVMHNVGGDPKMQAAAIRLEEFRLSQRNIEAGRAYEANPTPETKLAANNALADLNDFHNNPLAKIKSTFHHIGVLLQGERHVDLANYNGIRDAWLRSAPEGRTMTAATEKVLNRTASAVRERINNDKIATKALGDAIERETSKRRLPSADDVALDMAKQMNGNLPCPA